jgi:hypothetical protein
MLHHEPLRPAGLQLEQDQGTILETIKEPGRGIRQTRQLSRLLKVGRARERGAFAVTRGGGVLELATMGDLSNPSCLFTIRLKLMARCKKIAQDAISPRRNADMEKRAAGQPTIGRRICLLAPR